MKDFTIVQSPGIVRVFDAAQELMAQASGIPIMKLALSEEVAHLFRVAGGLMEQMEQVADCIDQWQGVMAALDDLEELEDPTPPVTD